MGSRVSGWGLRLEVVGFGIWGLAILLRVSWDVYLEVITVKAVKGKYKKGYKPS